MVVVTGGVEVGVLEVVSVLVVVVVDDGDGLVPSSPAISSPIP